MKSKLTVIVLFLCSLSLSAAANDNQYEALWQKGNTFYAQHQYDSAAFYFEKIAALKPHNAVVYYNLGNTYFRLNNIGLAVLNYQRALYINPSMQEAKDNLALTQSRINNAIPQASNIFFIQWWQSLTDANRSLLWAIVSLAIFLAMIGILFINRLRSNPISFMSQIMAILCFVWVISLTLAFVSAGNKLESSKAVVVQNDAPLMISQQGRQLRTVPEGTTVMLNQENGVWAEVRLPNGQTGWMQIGDLVKI